MFIVYYMYMRVVPYSLPDQLSYFIADHQARDTLYVYRGELEANWDPARLQVNLRSGIEMFVQKNFIHENIDKQ